jgi:4-hydroxyphenylpyruvate dioxygenase
VTGDLRLWSGTVFGAGFADRIAAAVAGGFSSISLFPIDHAAALAEGRTAADLRAMAADAGITIATLDPYARWVPDWRPPAGVDVSFLEQGEQDFLDAATALGVESVSVIEGLGVRYPVDLLTERFAAFCDAAAQRGLLVHLEFMPFSGVPDLATGWTIVRDAGRANGGLVLDLWHYLRGARDDDLLRSVPGDRIFVVQVSDADAAVVGSLLEDSMQRRRLPGTASFDTAGVLELVHRIGATRSIGAEVFSDDLRALGPVEAARRAGEALRRVLARVPAAGGTTPPGAGRP